MNVKVTQNISSKKPSSEEKFLMDFFDSKDYSYKFEDYRLNNLEGDTKFYRVPDFYLEKFNIYVEYYGLYNATKDIRLAYDLKSSLYIKNNIPTVFLYPHELGIIEYAFHAKMINVLKKEKFNLKRQFIKYKLIRFFDKTTNSNFAIFAICLMHVYIMLQFKNILKEDYFIFIFMCSIIIGIIFFFLILKDFRTYFIKEK